jgi:hypothetical protein
MVKSTEENTFVISKLFVAKARLNDGLSQG